MKPSSELFLTDRKAAWRNWKKPSPGDAVKVLGPVLRGICLDANVAEERATEWLQSQSPESITGESIDAFVRSITEIPADWLAMARAHQDQLERELAAEPLTQRDKVLLEREQPVEQRSRESIEDELYEAEHCKTRDGEVLPDLTYSQWRALEPHYAALEEELAKRDCRIRGVTYAAPVKRDHNLDMVPRMRG